MQKFYLSPTATTPEINLSPEENIMFIRGKSSPEDVRAMYYPVISWINTFINNIVEGKIITYSTENPLVFQIDLAYFNSSSAKFLFDIFAELKRLPAIGVAVKVEWAYDAEDIDLKEAGSDISLLAGMEFTYIPKAREI